LFLLVGHIRKKNLRVWGRQKGEREKGARLPLFSPLSARKGKAHGSWQKGKKCLRPHPRRGKKGTFRKKRGKKGERSVCRWCRILIRGMGNLVNRRRRGEDGEGGPELLLPIRCLRRWVLEERGRRIKRNRSLF